MFLTTVDRARVRRRQTHPALQPLRRSRLIKAGLLLSRRRGLSSNALPTSKTTFWSETATDPCRDLQRDERGVANGRAARFFLRLPDCLRTEPRLGDGRHPWPALRDEQLPDRLKPLVRIDAPSLDHHEIGRHVGHGEQGRTTARAIPAQDLKTAGAEVLEVRRFTGDRHRAAMYEDHCREGASGLRPAAVAMAKAGSEWLFGNGVADCAAHATARQHLRRL